jgi:glycosyltransferase involved in cell wall biosynthesis
MMLSAKRLNADVYVCNDLYTLPVGAFMKLLGKRIIYDSHELYPDLVGGTPHYLRRLMRSIESLLIRSADVVVTVNDFIATELSSRYNISYPIVIMNCPRTATSITTNRRKAERRKIVLYSGTFWQERGLENVVLACKYLRRDIQVVFRGEGAIESKLRDMSRDLENCVIEKPVPIGEVIRKAAEADVGIVPYLPTTLNNLYASPNKLFEYLQAGLPVIGSDLPFVRKVIVENDIGLVFDPFDPKDIARAMNHITQDKVLEAKKANVEKIRSRFSWEVESRKLLDAISSLSHRSTVIKQVDELGSLNR